MSRRGLTKAQQTALEKLRDEGERGAYPGISLGTLNSLSLRGLVRAKYRPGSMAMPHTSIKWSITEAGRRQLYVAADFAAIEARVLGVLGDGHE